MSDTPRSDAEKQSVLTWDKGEHPNSPLVGSATGWDAVDYTFSQQLERELKADNQKLEQIRKLVRDPNGDHNSLISHFIREILNS
jgi:hypothetical protein